MTIPSFLNHCLPHLDISQNADLLLFWVNDAHIYSSPLLPCKLFKQSYIYCFFYNRNRKKSNPPSFFHYSTSNSNGEFCSAIIKSATLQNNIQHNIQGCRFWGFLDQHLGTASTLSQIQSTVQGM